LFARARRLHGRIEGQDVGLKGDAVNDADDVEIFLELWLISIMVLTT